ncbi:MAG: hypothetical protein LR015_10545 [Verrucomicrobia bacterium]|nr:hypothetical protein [Verrucomicrobiota bacterium]
MTQKLKRTGGVSKFVNRGRQLDMIFDLAEGYAHLHVDLDSLHPVFKIGCSLVLRIYRPDEADERSRQALYFNTEFAKNSGSMPGLLGGWSHSGFTEDALAFHAFLPRYLYRPGLITWLIEDAVQRVAWLKNQSIRKVPRKSSAQICIPRSRPAALHAGDAEAAYIGKKLVSTKSRLWPEPLRVSGGFMDSGRQKGLFYFGKFREERPVWNCVGLFESAAIPQTVFLYHRKLTPWEQVNHLWGAFQTRDASDSELALFLSDWFGCSAQKHHALIPEVPSWVLPQPGKKEESQQFLRIALKQWGKNCGVDWYEAAEKLTECKCELLDTQAILHSRAAEDEADYRNDAGFISWWNTMADNEYLAAQVEATVQVWGKMKACPAVHKCPRNCSVCLHLDDLATILNNQGLPILNNHLKYCL